MGYRPYLDSIQDLTEGKELIASGMRQEVARCQAALRRARKGATVALISSGDAGIYGMAGLAIELAHADGDPVPIEIVPGVTAATAAGARLGAPLMLDFACISLSDLLVPWPVIRERLEAVAAADLVVALYNPRSKKRVTQLEEAAAIFLRCRPGATPVGIVASAGADGERIVLSDLDSFLGEAIDMKTTVIVGNRSSKWIGEWLVTPRGYHV